MHQVRSNNRLSVSLYFYYLFLRNSNQLIDKTRCQLKGNSKSNHFVIILILVEHLHTGLKGAKASNVCQTPCGCQEKERKQNEKIGLSAKYAPTDTYVLV